MQRLLLAAAVLVLVLSWAVVVVDGHFVVSYPQSRGYSYDTEFQFPCGGIAPTTNRSFWPTAGGAISIIPVLHPFSLTAVNIAIGNDINEHILLNPYSVPMVKLFNMTGVNATYCIPKVKIPGYIRDEVKHGVNATIQVIQLTGTNAALYACMDITFSDKEADRFGEQETWDKFCVNGTGMGGYHLGEQDPTTVNNTKVTSFAWRPTSPWGLAVGMGVFGVVFGFA